MQANEAKIGDTILYANMLWTVLDKDENGNIKIFAEDVDKQNIFDEETNNWAKCILRKKLPDLFPEINLFDLVEFERDLRTEDGCIDYGKCVDKISLISTDEYRKYREIISTTPGNWSWTLSGESIVFNGVVRYIDGYGTLGDSYCNDCGGCVRPLCVLKSSTEIKKFANNRKNG